MKVIRGKRALVTGAASGIGRAIALALAQEGADLYLLDVNPLGLAEVAGEASRRGVGVIAERCNLACADEVTAWTRAWERRGDSLDILVNNAGISYHGRTERMPAEQWDRLLCINLLAPIQLTRGLLPTLLARREAHVLNVCSIQGLVAIPGFTAYQTSKFGLVGFSESLRAEYLCRGLGVTALCPGFVRTKIFEAMVDGPHAKPMRTPPRWFFASPESVAARAVTAIYRNEGLVVVTGLARFLWLVKRISPRLWAAASRHRRKRAWAPGSASDNNPQPADAA